MYNFILQTLIMLSFGAIVYLMARALPRVSEEGPTNFSKDYVGRFLKRLPLEQADAWVSMALEKFLRKAKIVILKIDNLLTKHLSSLRGNAAPERTQLFSSEGGSLPVRQAGISGGEKKEEIGPAADIDKS